MPSPVAEALADLASALGRHGCPWFLFGAQAVILHGFPRLTADIDATVVCEHDDTDAILGHLRAVGIELRIPDEGGFVAATRVLPLRHVRTGMPIDLVLGGPGLEEEFAGRAEVLRVGRTDVPVARIEDVLIGKLIAGRHRDLEDARGLLLANPGRVNRREVRDTLRIVTEALGEADLVARFDAILAEIALES